MDKKSLSFLVVGLALGVLACTAVFSFLAGDSGTVNTGARVLKLGHSLDTTHPVHLGMVRMQERLEELSGGRMTIDIYPSGVLGSEEQCIEQLQSGVLAMTKTSSAAIESFLPAFGVFGVPYLFDDKEQFWEILEGPVGTELLAVGEPAGLVGLCYYDAGSRNFYSTERPIRSPEDLKGMKIRVQNSRMAVAMVETLGGAPTPIDWGELYSALAQGVVDGAENNPPSFETSRHYEVCKYFTPDAHTRVPDLLMMSARIWEGLSEQERGWVRQAAADSSLHQRELWAVETERSLERVKEAGVTIVECDPAAFQAAAMPMRADLVDTPVWPWLEKIEEAKR